MALRLTAATLVVVRSCLALAVLWALPQLAARPALAQAPAGAAAAEDDGRLTADELQQLVAPIALYPDPLIAIILPASTFPLDVVQAARFLDRRARAPDAQPDASWNEAVRALLNYPEVVKQLNDDLDWTNDLGLAVASQQADVLDAVQRYRRMALAAGNLRTDQRQRVEQSAESVVIEPANPEQVFVPQYDPQWSWCSNKRPRRWATTRPPIPTTPFPIRRATPSPALPPGWWSAG